MYLRDPHTPRLTIRPLTMADVPAWAEFFTDNPALQFLGLDNSWTPEEHATIWIERQLGRYRNGHGQLALTDKANGAFVGQCALLFQEYDGRTDIEVGYHILPRLQGRGLATEAATHFRDCAFNGLIDGPMSSRIGDSLISMIHIDNVRSQRVAEKNGMQRTVQTTFHDLPIYIYRGYKPNAL